ncbi:NAD-P-binding protein [Trametes coccinea BRFM310]|uniref:NAD-P-binding protein n=1 Tax=Trametes coccinea (strain BRFM310) TaxID=1353009 RepID=A0A1Y2IE76_TRAC3|nr:NAD-P-binding protein [Trametes coccinea BRFM310]
MPTEKKIILIIGATGAQGLAVIDALLHPSADGAPSPFAVRALTRDPNGRRAQELAKKGVELVQGRIEDLDTVYSALTEAYGAFVNTDSFTIGELKEVYYGIRIFEQAKQIKSVRHYVWSGLDNIFKRTNYNPEYYAEHYTGKCRVSDWMRSQDSIVSDDNMSWSILTTGPYMDSLKTGVFGPMKVRPDGTYVFTSPVGKGHVPMIALSDLGYFARYIFDHRKETSAQELEIASDWVGWDYLVETFSKVTGKKAEYVPLTIDEWFGLFDKEGVNRPVASERPVGDGSTTRKENFSRWWRLYRDEIIKRDFNWIRRVNPQGHTLESWMRANGYAGEKVNLLKAHDEGHGHWKIDAERIAQL